MAQNIITPQKWNQRLFISGFGILHQGFNTELKLMSDEFNQEKAIYASDSYLLYNIIPIVPLRFEKCGETWSLFISSNSNTNIIAWKIKNHDCEISCAPIDETCGIYQTIYGYNITICCINHSWF